MLLLDHIREFSSQKISIFQHRFVTRIRNLGGNDRIINPMVQIVNKGGCLHGTRGGRTPLPAVPLLHLQMEVMDQFHNTKVTTPERGEALFEGGSM